MQAIAEAADPGEREERRGLEWLETARRDGTRRAGRRLQPEDTATAGLSSVTVRLKRKLTAQPGGLYGALTDAGSSFSQRTERVVFQRGVESAFERLSLTLASITETIENHVFQLGPGRVAQFGGRIRRALLLMETFLGRPVVAAVVALICIVAAVAVR